MLRVPAARYDEAVASLRAAAENVRGIGVSTQDVTAEVADLEATVANLRAVEAQYVQLLSRAQAINDVLTVQEKVRQVRLEIDRTQARLALTSRLTDLATITVRISPLPLPSTVERPGPLAAAVMGWGASLEVLRVTVSALVLVVVFSWWLLPVIAVVVFVVRRLRGRRRPAVVTPSV